VPCKKGDCNCLPNKGVRVFSLSFYGFIPSPAQAAHSDRVEGHSCGRPQPERFNSAERFKHILAWALAGTIYIMCYVC